MRVAAVDADDKVALKPVVLGRNLGNRVEIESGLALSDRLVDSPLEIDPDRRHGECRQRGRESRRSRVNGKRETRAEQTAEPLSF